MSMHLFWLLPHVTGTLPWLLRPLRISDSSELYLTLGFFLFFIFFLNAQVSSFLIHSLVTFRTSCHARGHSHSYLGKRRISLGVTIILSICLCSHTQLDCSQFTITSRFVFIHVKTLNILLMVKTLIKKYRVAVTVFSIRKNIRQQPY